MTGPTSKGLQLKVDNRNAISKKSTKIMAKKRVLDENNVSKRTSKRIKKEIHETAQEDSEEALRLMSNSEIPSDYYKILSERRRVALEKSLEENERLHETIRDLKADNEKLKELADEADYFAKMLNEVLEQKSEFEDPSKDNEDTHSILEQKSEFEDPSKDNEDTHSS